ncbi:uncharacterized protein LOC124681195 isoform X2 [Lolium rigidum]|nr:uncharacterized protein LOC124681195 isoform X2 [Lolium rigidum]
MVAALLRLGIVDAAIHTYNMEQKGHRHWGAEIFDLGQFDSLCRHGLFSPHEDKITIYNGADLLQVYTILEQGKCAGWFTFVIVAACHWLWFWHPLALRAASLAPAGSIAPSTGFWAWQSGDISLNHDAGITVTNFMASLSVNFIYVYCFKLFSDDFSVEYMVLTF